MSLRSCSPPSSAAPSQEAGSMSPVWLYGLLILAVLATYGRILQHEFVDWDDGGHITNNPHLDPVSWKSMVHFWREPYFFHYVPASYTLFTLEAWLAQSSRDATGDLQFNPAIFHAGSLVLHIGCVLLTYRLLSILRGQRVAAAAGALLFALHPLQVESVAWISEQRGLLCAMFSLLCLMAYLKFGA